MPPGRTKKETPVMLRTLKRRWLNLPLAVGVLLLAGGAVSAHACPAFLDHEFQKLHSAERVNLCKAFGGKPLLIVNTASHCGYTPQFKGLEALHEKYRDRGLVVIGFPSDDFQQEAKDEAETAQVCFMNYGVTFTMLSPLPVKGATAWSANWRAKPASRSGISTSTWSSPTARWPTISTAR
jgi:glutathione peroxidase